MRACLVVETVKDSRYLLSGLLRPQRSVSQASTKPLRCCARVVDFYWQRALAASMAWMPIVAGLQELWPALVISPDLSVMSARHAVG